MERACSCACPVTIAAPWREGKEGGHTTFEAHSVRLARRAMPDHSGDLDGESKRILDRSKSPEDSGQCALDLRRRTVNLRPGTVLSREWNGRMHRAAVLADGFAWNGKTYPSLSKVAFAITGTRWNGPKFFGLRQASKGGEHDD
jgi:hypothetical protein